MIRDLILKNRSYRRFDETAKTTVEQVTSWVDLARLSPFGSNKQSLKFMISVDEETNALIFPTLNWAGALKDWDGPAEGERPAAYIVILGDHEISKTFGVNHGIAAQSILLGAVADGYGGCMLGSIKRPILQEALQLNEHYEILLVIALGKPVEKVKVTDIPENGSIDYWRDGTGIHYVPKRTLQDILLKMN